MSLHVGPPEWTPLPAGRALYVPEPIYLEPYTTDFPARRAFRVVAITVARRAKSFTATKMHPRGNIPRSGALPPNPDERAALVAGLLDWMEDTSDLPPSPIESTTVILGLSDAPIDLLGLSYHLVSFAQDPQNVRLDIPNSTLNLTAEEYAELQAALTREGLPADFYFPLEERRESIEPAEWYDEGGLYSPQPRGEPSGRFVLVRLQYSPGQWARRKHEEIAARRIPTEQERQGYFYQSLHAFLRKVELRQAELSEPGKLGRTREQRLVSELRDTLMGLHWDIEGARPEGFPGHRPTAGWKDTPTLRQALESALPSLRRLYPAGHIISIEALWIEGEAEVPNWFLTVQVPDEQGVHRHDVRNGVLIEGHHVPFPPSGPPVLSLGDTELPDFADSPAAIAASESAGGQEFRERTGGGLRSLRLAHADDGRLQWSISYELEHTRDHLQVTLDGRTLEVLSASDQLYSPHIITVAGMAQPDRRRLRPEGPARTYHILTLTAMLEPRLLHDRTVPPLRVGDRLEVALALQLEMVGRLQQDLPDELLHLGFGRYRFRGTVVAEHHATGVPPYGDLRMAIVEAEGVRLAAVHMAAFKPGARVHGDGLLYVDFLWTNYIRTLPGFVGPDIRSQYTVDHLWRVSLPVAPTKNFPTSFGLAQELKPEAYSDEDMVEASSTDLAISSPDETSFRPGFFLVRFRAVSDQPSSP